MVLRFEILHLSLDLCIMNLKIPPVFASIDISTVPMTDLPQKLCFIDIETTGTSFRFDRIIEIGALRIENNKLVDSFQTLINPERFVPSEITSLTGITSADLEGAPSFFDIRERLLELLDSAFFVAHNVRFDYGFIKNEFKLLGYPFQSKQLCTVKLSRNLYPEQTHHNLDSIIQRFGFKIKRRHRAFDDAEVLWKFFQKIGKSFPQQRLVEALNKTTKRPSLPVRLSEEYLDNLPESPGVYIFYGKEGCPLYVGKSINIRERVLSHFSSDTTSSKEMKISQQIESIEVIQTEGELGALLKESFLIKKMQPLYNRKLRYARQIFVLKYNPNALGYNICVFDIQDQIDPSTLQTIIGVFRSRKSVKEFLVYFAKQFMLCEKLLGIDPSTKECFGYRLGRCKGACVGKENPLAYNIRFLEAFTDHKFKRWPFETPIIIDDISTDGSAKVSFVIDNWCVLGTYNNEDSKLETYEDVGFDMDTYKILSSFLLKMSNQKFVKAFKQKDLSFKDQENIPVDYL